MQERDRQLIDFVAQSSHVAMAEAKEEDHSVTLDESDEKCPALAQEVCVRARRGLCGVLRVRAERRCHSPRLQRSAPTVGRAQVGWAGQGRALGQTADGRARRGGVGRGGGLVNWKKVAAKGEVGDWQGMRVPMEHERRAFFLGGGFPACAD